MGLIAALLVAASACGGTSAEGTGTRSPTTGYTGGVTDAVAGGEVFFPRHREAVPGVGLDGRIFEDGAGCLRFEISYDDAVTGGEDPTVLWPKPWSAEREKEGRVRFFDVEGRAVGRTGEEVFLVGSILPSENSLEEVQSVDEPTTRELHRRCPGLYYFTGDIEPPFATRGETTSGQYTVDRE